MDINKIMGIPRSLVYDLILFGKKGITLPVLFAKNTRVKGLRKGCIAVQKNKGRVFIGFGGTEGIQPAKHTNIVIGRTGKIVFEGKAVLGSGTAVRVDDGICTFGDNFSCNTNCFISCAKAVTFGNNCLLGWNVNIRDVDGHVILTKGEKGCCLKPIKIGNNVWIASNVDILKGVTIGNANVIGYRSCVTKSILEENCLIAGYPATVIKRGIEWEY